jgi:hypothetical protein
MAISLEATLKLYHAISLTDPNPVLLASYIKGIDFNPGDIIDYTSLAVNYTSRLFLWTYYDQILNVEALLGLEKVTDTPLGNSNIVLFDNGIIYGVANAVGTTAAISSISLLSPLFELDVTNFINLFYGDNRGIYFLYSSPFPYNVNSVVRFGNYTKGEFNFETDIRDFTVDLENLISKGILFCSYQDPDTGREYSVDLSIVSQTPSGSSSLVPVTYQRFSGMGVVYKGNGQRLRVAASFIAPPIITGVSPSSASIGAAVTITGTNFTAPLDIGFWDGIYARATVVSSTQATITVPAGTTTGVLSASGPRGFSESTVVFTVV